MDNALISPAIGQIRQAMARRNAGRGQTPNAPEVNDEPGFGLGNRSGVDPLGGAAKLAAPLNRAVSAVSGAYQQGAQSPIPGAGLVAGGREAVKQAAFTIPGAYRDQAIGAVQPALRTAGALGSIAATGNLPSPTDNAAGLPGPPAAPAQAIAAPSPGTDPDEQGSGHRGDSYGPSQSVTVTPRTPGNTPPVVPQPTDMTQRNNRAELDAMNAREAAGQDTQRRQSLAAAHAGQLSQDLSKAQGEQRVANFVAANGADMILGGGPNAPSYADQRQEIARQSGAADARVATLQGQQNAAQTAVGTTGRDPIADQIASSNAVVGQQEGLQRIATAPVQNAIGGQQAVAGEQSNRLAQLQVQAREREQGILSGLDKASTPEEREQIIGQVMALRGQPMYETHVGPGGVNPATGTMFPGQAFIVNKLRGTATQVGGQQTSRQDATIGAREAIAKGANKAAVNQRLKDAGFPPID